MANKILIQCKVDDDFFAKFVSSRLSISLGRNFIIETPLIDDQFFETQSQFASFGDFIPKVTEILRTVTSLGSATGTVPGALLDFTSKLDVPKWNRTEPLKLTLKLFFGTKTNPEADVWIPMQILMGYSILSIDKKKNEIKVPGISLKNINKVKVKINPKKFKASSFSEEDRLVVLEIPGMVYLQNAIVISARPTFSKHQTSSGYPLWGVLDLQVQSVGPATTEMLRDVTPYIKDPSIIDVELSQIKRTTTFNF